MEEFAKDLVLFAGDDSAKKTEVTSTNMEIAMPAAIASCAMFHRKGDCSPCGGLASRDRPATDAFSARIQ